jgi:hypothetical protein
MNKVFSAEGDLETSGDVDRVDRCGFTRFDDTTLTDSFEFPQ